MKKILVLCCAIALTGCGSKSTPATPTNQLTGTWNVAVSQSGQPTVNLTALLAGGACQVSDPNAGTFTVQGPSCVLADNQTGVGHVSSVNSSLIPEGVLIGSPANPAPDGASLNFLYAAIDSSSNLYVFSGSGSVTGNTMSGSWSCYSGVTICSGWTGTFTAQRQ